MKKFGNLVLVILILVSPFKQKVDAPAIAKGGRAVVAKAPQKKALFKNVCDEVKGSYVAGELIVTLKDKADTLRLKTISPKSFYALRKNNSIDYLLSETNAIEVQSLYDVNLDNEYNASNLLKVTKDKLEQKHLTSKLKFHQLMRESSVARSYHIKTDLDGCNSMNSLVEDLKDNPRVEHIELNRIHHVASVDSGEPNDELFSTQANLVTIEAPGAWPRSTGTRSDDTSVRIGVIDQYIKTDHEDLADNISTNESRNSTATDQTHGTEVAGVIAAIGDNFKGIVGVAPTAKIVFASAPTLSGTEITAAIQYLIDIHVDVINMSINFYRNGRITDYENDPEYLVVKQAIDSGIPFIASAGNENVNIDSHVGNVYEEGDVNKKVLCFGTDESPCFGFYPAIPRVIAVGASDNDVRASFSNYGTNVDISAPGLNVQTTSFNASEDIDTYEDTYTIVKGSSFSSATVAAAAALFLAIDELLSPNQLESILVHGARTINTDQLIGPRLNITNSLRFADHFRVINQERYLDLQRRLADQEARLGYEAPLILSFINNSVAKTLSASWFFGRRFEYRYAVFQCREALSFAERIRGDCDEEHDETQLVISETVTFNNNIYIPNISISTASLNPGNYEFRVQACNKGGSCSDFNDRLFVVAAPPPTTITNPKPDGTTIFNTARPSFTWTAVSGATGYDILVTHRASGRRVIVTSVPDPTYTPTTFDLLFDGIYTVEVKANISGARYSTPVTFQVATVLPATPSGITVSGINTFNSVSITSSNRPNVTCQAVTGATSYRAVINRLFADGTLARIGVPLDVSPINGTSFLYPTYARDLSRKETYRVSVFAINAAGESSAGTLDFYVGRVYATTASVAPTLTAVTAAVTTAPNITNLPKPTLQWSSIPVSPDYYELQILDGASGNLVQGPFYIKALPIYTPAPGPQYTPTTDLANGYYKFKVRVLNGGTTGTPTGAGPWSAEKAFYVDATSTAVPLAPVITSPVNNATVSATPTLQWNVVSNAVYYKFDINKATNTAGTTFSSTNLYANKQTVYNETSHTVSPALSAGLYRVRMYAYNARGKSAATSTYVNFRVQ